MIIQIEIRTQWKHMRGWKNQVRNIIDFELRCTHSRGLKGRNPGSRRISRHLVKMDTYENMVLLYPKLPVPGPTWTPISREQAPHLLMYVEKLIIKRSGDFPYDD